MHIFSNNLILSLLEGILVTLKLFVITVLISIPLGLILSILRISSFKILNVIVGSYIWIMRGTPLLLQLFFIYFTLPLIGIILPAFTSALIAFVLNYAAYFAEIFRAGIQSIDKGQYEGAKALGMSNTQTMKRIVLPQVIKRTLPPVSNEVITLIKDTSLVYVVAINDLFKITYSIVNATGNTMVFLVAAVFYLLMTLIFTWIFQKLEKHYQRYEG